MLESILHQLGARLDAKVSHDRVSVKGYRALGHMEEVGDFLHCAALREKLQHFAPARGKLSPREASWPGENGPRARSCQNDIFVDLHCQFRERSSKLIELSFCGVIAVVSALAQPNSQFPVSANVPEPTPTAQTSPLLTPETRPLANYCRTDAFAFSQCSAFSQSDAASRWHNAPASAGDAYARPSGR